MAAQARDTGGAERGFHCDVTCIPADGEVAYSCFTLGVCMMICFASQSLPSVASFILREKSYAEKCSALVEVL